MSEQEQQFQKLSQQRLEEIQAVYDSPEWATWRTKYRAEMPNSSAAHFCELLEAYHAQEQEHDKAATKLGELAMEADKLEAALSEARARIAELEKTALRKCKDCGHFEKKHFRYVTPPCQFAECNCKRFAY